MSVLESSERANDSLRSHSLPAIMVTVVEGQAWGRGVGLGGEARGGRKYVGLRGRVGLDEGKDY